MATGLLLPHRADGGDGLRLHGVGCDGVCGVVGGLMGRNY